MRSFVILLLLIIVFLGGMITGLEREQHSANRSNNLVTELEEVTEDEVAVVHSLDEDVNLPLHVTQKTATWLEKGVKGFYEVIVEILYQISTLFF